MHVVLQRMPDGAVRVTDVDGDAAGAVRDVVPTDLPHLVREREGVRPRWVWGATTEWYPELLAAGVRVERAADLRLRRAILRAAVATAGSDLARGPRDDWDDAVTAAPPDAATTLFELAPARHEPDPVQEFRRQQAAVADAADPARLELLLAAESVGALAAAEMRFAGLPWSAERHDALLRAQVGDPVAGGRPTRLEAAADAVRAALDAPALNPDSQPDLLRALRHAGLAVDSTSKWELTRHEHPAVPVVLEYKALSRLLTANGWAWLDEWVHDGRFRPVYVPGGVVTGRWATDGGGALQLPKAIRAAVVPDPGWRLVVADAAQLEPRVLGAMSRDTALARAGAAADLYQGMVDAGAVETRQQAKYGVLGAIYGGTTGESGRVRPRIERAYPAAFGYVEAAARAGERGEVVSTWLGRGSPPGDADAYDETAAPSVREAARRRARERGRFTRNFVVQGTAAEWALCWIGALRRRLWRIGGADEGPPAAVDGGPGVLDRPHLVFFVHDELVVHAPAGVADRVAEAMRESAAEAGRLLFGETPVEFAVSVAVVDSYADAK